MRRQRPLASIWWRINGCSPVTAAISSAPDAPPPSPRESERTCPPNIPMCGIVGYIGTQRAVPIILEGLKRLEYRGYDSAGLAVYGADNQLHVRRAEGKLRNLEKAIQSDPVDGLYGIGHTRWATHGRPTEENAHPHRDCKGDIVVVHNGIVENYLALK